MTKQFWLGLLLGVLVMGGMWGYQHWQDIHAPGCDARDPDCQIIEGSVSLRPGMNLNHILVLSHTPDEPCFIADAKQFKESSSPSSVKNVFCRGGAFIGDPPVKDGNIITVGSLKYMLDASGKWELPK